MSQTTETKAEQETIEMSHPTELAMRLLSITKADRRVSLILSCLTLYAYFTYGKLGLLAALLFVAACLYRGEYGRNYYTVWELCVGAYIMVVLRDVVWTSQPPKGRLMSLLRRMSPLAIDVEILEDPEGRIDPIGLMYARPEKTDSVLILGDGSDISSVDPVTQARRLAQRAYSSKMVASLPGGQHVGISFVFRRRRTDVEAIRDWDTANSLPDVLLPEALVTETGEPKPQEAWTDRDYRMVFLSGALGSGWDMVERKTGQVDMCAVLTIPRQSGLAGLQSGRDIGRLPLVQMAQREVAGLAASRVDNPRIGTPEEVESHLRRAWDVATSDQYDLERSEQDPEGIDLTTTVRQWPHNDDSKIIVKRDRCIIEDTIDGTVRRTIHGVIRVKSSPSRPVPNWLRQVFAADVRWLSVALVGETLGYRGEYWWLNKFIPLRAEFLQGLLGRDDSDPRSQDAEEKLVNRREEIYRALFIQNYAVLIVHSATDEQQFEDDRQEIMRHLSSVVGIKSTVIKGRGRITNYVLSGTTGVPYKL